MPSSLYLTKLNNSPCGWQGPLSFSTLRSSLTNRRKANNRKAAGMILKLLPASFFVGSQNSWQNQIFGSVQYLDDYHSLLLSSEGYRQVLLAIPIMIIILWKGILKISRLVLPCLAMHPGILKVKHGRIIFKSRPCVLLTVTEQTIDTLLTWTLVNSSVRLT